MTTAELKARTKEFALRVIRLVDALPNTIKGSRNRESDYAKGNFDCRELSRCLSGAISGRIHRQNWGG